MGYAVGPWVPVLMVSLQDLSQQAWSGKLPPVTVGQPFWATSRDVPSLVSSGLAQLAPAGTTEPPAEPAWTVRGQPGFAAGTSNGTRTWVPSAGGTADGGGAVPAYPQQQGGVIDGGPDASGGHASGDG
jgi:hypothetical protein